MCGIEKLLSDFKFIRVIYINDLNKYITIIEYSLIIINY
jgi:hypothetical protein